MDNKIKKSYHRICMSQDAKDRIFAQIMDSEGNGSREPEDGGRIGRKMRRSAVSGWKVTVAACLGLALLIPTGVYAAGKISEYFTVTIGQEKYQAKIKMSRSDGTVKATLSKEEKSGKEDAKAAGKHSAEPDQYIKVKADFGKEYSYADQSYDYYMDEDGKVTTVKHDISEGTYGMYEYVHRDGEDAAKDFYYNVMYMDVGEDEILKLYDKAFIREITVDGHKAVLCQSNLVQGSRYNSEHDTDYTLDVYVFYEEYGYVIDFCGMEGLGMEKLISLARSVSVTEAEKGQASRYEYLSRLQKADMQKYQEEEEEEIKSPVKGLNQKVAYEGLTCQVTDVKISSRVKDTDLKKFNDSFFTQKSGYWDGKGTLKPYVREKTEQGDGVSKPEVSVTGKEKAQPKMVYVTMKVKAEREALFQLPEVSFMAKENGKYINNHNRRFWQYNRPEKIEDALIDFMPCYFKETAGGKGFWLKEMKKGEEQVYHFAYMVDGDLAGDMVLLFNADNSQSEIQYIDLWK